MIDSRKFSAKDAAAEELNDGIEVLYDSCTSGAELGDVGTANSIMNKPDEKKVDARVKGDEGNCDSCHCLTFLYIVPRVELCLVRRIFRY